MRRSAILLVFAFIFCLCLASIIYADTLIYNNSNFTGSVNCIISGKYLGGLAGRLVNTTVMNCYSDASVSTFWIGGQYMGGFAGAASHLMNCYSIGRVITDDGIYVGGLTGFSGVGSIISSYWDTETSNQSSSGGGTGLTTQQMQTMSSYTNWDFVDTWWICDGMNYPRLQWKQKPEGDFVCPDGVGIEDVGMFSQCWLVDMDLLTELDDDDDKIVGLVEVARLGQYWLQDGCGNCGGIDTTGDGNVNDADLMDIVYDWLREVHPECSQCDINTDGDINLGDFSRFSQNWLFE